MFCYCWAVTPQSQGELGVQGFGDTQLGQLSPWMIQTEWQHLSVPVLLHGGRSAILGMAKPGMGNVELILFLCPWIFPPQINWIYPNPWALCCFPTPPGWQDRYLGLSCEPGLNQTPKALINLLEFGSREILTLYNCSAGLLFRPDYRLANICKGEKKRRNLYGNDF